MIQKHQTVLDSIIQHIKLIIILVDHKRKRERIKDLKDEIKCTHEGEGGKQSTLGRIYSTCVLQREDKIK